MYIYIYIYIFFLENTGKRNKRGDYIHKENKHFFQHMFLEGGGVLFPHRKKKELFPGYLTSLLPRKENPETRTRRRLEKPSGILDQTQSRKRKPGGKTNKFRVYESVTTDVK